MLTVEHDESNPQPFGLEPAALRACYARSGERPKGMSRYEAFAYQIEAEIARSRTTAEPGVLPLVRAYARLRRHADRLAATLSHGIEIIDRHTPFDVTPGRAVLTAYQIEVENED